MLYGNLKSSPHCMSHLFNKKEIKIIEKEKKTVLYQILGKRKYGGARDKNKRWEGKLAKYR